MCQNYQIIAGYTHLSHTKLLNLLYSCERIVLDFQFTSFIIKYLQKQSRSMLLKKPQSCLAGYANLKDFLQIHDVWNVPKTSQPAFLEHLLWKLDSHIAVQGKCIIITLTKKSSEEVTNFLVSKGYKAFYLHSEIATFDRREIIKKLKTWAIDIIVGVNLLREGIDLPELTLLAILDADKEWFLRSTTALIQIIWRASRNPKGEVILYADHFTESMTKALRETYRRRSIQDRYNKAHKITPTKATSNVKSLEVVKTDENLTQWFNALTRGKVKRLKRMTKAEQAIIAKDLKKQLDEAIKNREFEKATIIRDQIKEMEGD